MSSRLRLVLPLVAVAVLLAVALAVFLWPAPEAPRAPEVTQAFPPVKPLVASPAPPAGPMKRAEAEPVQMAARAEAEVVDPVTGARGTVVPVGPGDEVPAPDMGGPEQENDPIEPEKPQTAAWRHSKVVRISEVLRRDVARLEQERDHAEAQGNAAEVKRLDVVIARHQAHLGKLREEAAALAEAARNEPPEP
jgi:hypothetical protein